MTRGEELARKGQDVFFKIENAPKYEIALLLTVCIRRRWLPRLAMACHFRLTSENT